MLLDRLVKPFKSLLSSNSSSKSELDDIQKILSKYEEDKNGLLPMAEEDREFAQKVLNTIPAQPEPAIRSTAADTDSVKDKKAVKKVNPAQLESKKKDKKKKKIKDKKNETDDPRIRDLQNIIERNSKDIEVNLYKESGKKEQTYEEKIVEAKTTKVEKLSQDQLDRLSMIEQLNDQADDALSQIDLRERFTDIMTSDELEQRDFSDDRNKQTDEDDEDQKDNFIKSIILLIESASMRTKIIMLGVIGFLVIGLIVSTIIVSSKIPKNVKPDIIAFNSDYATNGANYIYLNMQATLNNKPLVLQRMQIDALSTVFYFNVELNNTNYEYTLVDENGKVYNMDFAFLPTDSLTPNGTRELRFEPLHEGIKSFTLTITDIENKISANFDVLFDAGIVYPPAKYIDAPIQISDEDSYHLELANARFSSSGSILNFRLTHKEQDQGVKFLQKMMDDNIKLYEMSSRVLPNRKDPIINQVSEDGTFLMQLSYLPLKNLETKLSILVQNLFISVPYNQDVDTAGLFVNSTDTEKVIEIGDKKLVLERMGMGDNMAVLVLHSEEASQELSNEQADDEYEPPIDPNASRVETRLDVELIAEISPGITLVFKPEQYSEQEGTDLIFNLGNSAKTVSSLPKENIKLHISNIYFKSKDVEIPIDLSEYKYVRDSKAESAITSIVNSFNQRLLYKSGLLPADDITGFAENASNLDSNDYTPYNVMVLANKPLFSAQIISYSIVNDKIYAIVQENWKLGIENLDVRFYRKHEVIAQKDPSANKWTIIYDKIKK